MEMNEKNQMQNSQQPSTKYYCPMKCEGDKTYDQPGTCPVCNMRLIPVGEKGHR
jgi:protein SCO1